MARETSKIDAHVGTRVRMRRMEQKISQAELGSALGISFQQVQKYERGMNRISTGTLAAIATKLDCPISYFYENAPGKRGGGDTSEMTEFMTSPMGMDIAKAFIRLPEGKLRSSLRDVVVGVAESHAAIATRQQPRARAA